MRRRPVAPLPRPLTSNFVNRKIHLGKKFIWKSGVEPRFLYKGGRDAGIRY
jgi:hypothetical protein